MTRGAEPFPGTRRPVLWAGGRDRWRRSERLSRALDQAAGVAGVAPGDRPLRLHVTLARVRATGRAPSSLEAVVSRWESVELGRFVAREVTLYRSDLGNGPARYTILEQLPLSPGSS
ncbi:MAG: 2'-5' RNA ligase family protein [Acidobacteriota bacterium]